MAVDGGVNASGTVIVAGAAIGTGGVIVTTVAVIGAC